MPYKAFCHCGAKIINGHHCENGHIMVRDEEHHAQLRHTAISREDQIQKRIEENTEMLIRLAVEFGWLANERGLTLDETIIAHDKARKGELK